MVLACEEVHVGNASNLNFQTRKDKARLEEQKERQSEAQCCQGGFLY